MYELAITIALAILFTLFSYIFSHILMKRFKITHPKNRFWVYAIVMMTAFSIFSFSFIAIGFSPNNGIQSDIINNESEEVSYSMVMVLEETGLGDSENCISNNGILINNSPLISSIDKTVEENSSLHSTIAFFSNFSEKQSKLISQMFSRYRTDLYDISNSANPTEEETVISSLFTDIVYQDFNTKSTNSYYISVFLIVNLLLIIICALYLTFSFVVGKKYIIRNFNAKECDNSEILKIAEGLSKELKIKSIKVFVYDGAPNAFVFGFPASLAISKELINCLSKKELCMAIRHELAHIKNKDLIIKPILQVLRILFFYNPIVHLLYYKMIREMELMADSLFINSKKEKVTLMEALVKIHKNSTRQKLLSKNYYDSYSLSLLSNNFNKLEIIDRFNHLFGRNVKKSFYSFLICLIILISNISMMGVAKNVLDNSDFEYIEQKIISDDLSDEKFNNSHQVKYIFRVFEEYYPEFYKKYSIYLVLIDIQKENLSSKDLFNTIKLLLTE
jgi:beta-lactamase regulating signal transducer with metallopeptidase domain